MNNTKEQIITEALQYLNKNSWASFVDICSNLSVSRATAYRYFKDKDHLLYETYEYCLEKILEIINKYSKLDITNIEKFDGILTDIVPLWNEFWFISAMYYDYYESENFDKYIKVENALSELIDKLKKQWHIRDDLPTKWIVYTVYNLLHQGWLYMYEWYTGSKLLPELIKTTLNIWIYKQK